MMERSETVDMLLNADGLPFAAMLWEEERLFQTGAGDYFALDWDIITREWPE